MFCCLAREVLRRTYSILYSIQCTLMRPSMTFLFRHTRPQLCLVCAPQVCVCPTRRRRKPPSRVRMETARQQERAECATFINSPSQSKLFHVFLGRGCSNICWTCKVTLAAWAPAPGRSVDRRPQLVHTTELGGEPSLLPRRPRERILFSVPRRAV